MRTSSKPYEKIGTSQGSALIEPHSGPSMSSSPREYTLEETRSDQKLERPRMWRVLLHNDDYTTQDFVVWVLETIFRKPRAEAFAIMMSVHRSGLGIAGVFTHDVAETKVRATQRAAEEQEFPLLVTMEPETENVNQ
jgi:ATP-dependent Clp protease adaptor protein ClpS